MSANAGPDIGPIPWATIEAAPVTERHRLDRSASTGISRRITPPPTRLVVLDAFRPPDGWPDAIVLDSKPIPFTLTTRLPNGTITSQQAAYHLLGIHGYPAGRGSGRPWRIFVVGGADGVEWEKGRDPGHPAGCGLPAGPAPDAALRLRTTAVTQIRTAASATRNGTHGVITPSHASGNREWSMATPPATRACPRSAGRSRSAGTTTESSVAPSVTSSWSRH
jgi:hypothetical protein